MRSLKHACPHHQTGWFSSTTILRTPARHFYLLLLTRRRLLYVIATLPKSASGTAAAVPSERLSGLGTVPGLLRSSHAAAKYSVFQGLASSRGWRRWHAWSRRLQ